MTDTSTPMAFKQEGPNQLIREGAFPEYLWDRFGVGQRCWACSQRLVVIKSRGAESEWLLLARRSRYLKVDGASGIPAA